MRNSISLQTTKFNYLKISILTICFILIATLTLTVDADGISYTSYLYWKQILTIILGSFSLGIATYLLQEMTNNKLADTSILGIGNINLIVAIFLTLNFNVSNLVESQNFLTKNSIFFMFFSIAITIIIYLLSKYKSNINKNKMIIIGVVLNFCLIGTYYGLINLVPANKKNYIDVYLNGGVFILSELQYIFGFVMLFICILLIFLNKSKMHILFTNKQIAISLGINPNRIYIFTLLMIGILTGISFYSLGNVVLLGLIASSISSILFKRNYKFSIISSGIIAAIFLNLSFYLVSLISSIYPKISGLEIYFFPIIGIPYFIFIATKKDVMFK